MNQVGYDKSNKMMETAEMKKMQNVEYILMDLKKKV